MVSPISPSSAAATVVPSPANANQDFSDTKQKNEGVESRSNVLPAVEQGSSSDRGSTRQEGNFFSDLAQEDGKRTNQSDLALQNEFEDPQVVANENAEEARRANIAADADKREEIIALNRNAADQVASSRESSAVLEKINEAKSAASELSAKQAQQASIDEGGQARTQSSSKPKPGVAVADAKEVETSPAKSFEDAKPAVKKSKPSDAGQGGETKSQASAEPKKKASVSFESVQKQPVVDPAKRDASDQTAL